MLALTFTQRIIQFVVGLFFVVTCIFKIFSFPQFILDIQNFDILPINIILPFSILVILTELLSGIALLLNVYTKAFSILLICLLSMFTIAIIFNLLRGNIVNCGCFGNILFKGITWWKVFINVLLCYILFWSVKK